MTRVGRRFAIALAAVLGCAGAGHAQPANPEVPAHTRTVKLTLEQRHVIRELIKELKVERAPESVGVSAGDQVPGGVSPRPIPSLIGQKVPQIRAHRFYVTQSQIVIVDPQDSTVVEVID